MSQRAGTAGTQTLWRESKASEHGVGRARAGVVGDEVRGKQVGPARPVSEEKVLAAKQRAFRRF